MKRAKIAFSILFSGFAIYVFLIASAREARAEPSWARKYNSDCTLCHTIYPRLNRTGYVFKRLGYRFPSELAKKAVPASSTTDLQPAHAVVSPQEQNYAPTPWSAAAEAGKLAIQRFNCATCHQIEGSGGRIGPSLDGVGGRRSPQFIRDHIINPSQHVDQYGPEYRRGGELMPKVEASAAEIEHLTAYLLTLKYQPMRGPVPHPASSGQQILSPAYIPAEMTSTAEEGRKLYLSTGCAACHSIAGSGGDVGPKLDGIGARRSPVWLMRHITNPQKHIETQPQAHETTTSMMPPTELSPVEIAKITDFLLTLPTTKDQEKASIPRNRWPDYFGVAYLPAVELRRSSGVSENEFERRELNLYIAGTLGPNFSLFAQPIPAVKGVSGFPNYFEMIQGSFNYGSAENFLQVRFGQIFNLQNAGFGGSDRSITGTFPLPFGSANGFNPGELGRGVSVEYTTKGLTTFKAFANYQTAPEFEEDASGTPLPEARRSRTYGFVFEKVIGSKGLSGVQFQFAGGYTPILSSGQFLPALRFQRYSVFVNRTFQDKRNVERLNLIGGVTAFRDDRILDLPQARSKGYGYFFEANWIPVRRVGLLVRYDQLRPTTLIGNNTLRSETAAVIFDFTKYTRMLFEYQHAERFEPTNLYRIAWQLNF